MKALSSQDFSQKNSYRPELQMSHDSTYDWITGSFPASVPSLGNSHRSNVSLIKIKRKQKLKRVVISQILNLPS
jgi:hypothetical protein